MAGRNITYSMSLLFSGKDDFTSTANKVKGSMASVDSATKRMVEGSKKSINELAGAYNALVVASRGVRVMGAMVKPAVDMQQAMTELKVATNLQRGEVDQLAAAARRAAAATPFAPPEAIRAAKDLNLVMRDVNATSDSMTSALQLAHVYMGGKVTATTKMLGNIIGGFNLKGTEAVGVMDKLVAAQLATGTSVEKMSEGFKMLGLVSEVVKTDFDDILPVFALAVRGMGSASSAATGLRTGFMNLSDARKRAAIETAFEIDLLDGETGRLKSVTQVMHILATAAERYKDNWVGFQHVLQKALGKRAAKPFIAVMGQLRSGFADSTGMVHRFGEALGYVHGQVQSSQGALGRTTEEYMAPMTGQVALLRENLGILAERAFTPLVQILTPFVGWIKAAVEGVSALLDRYPILGTILSHVASGFAILVGVAGLLLAKNLATEAVSRILGQALQFVGQNLAANSVAATLGCTAWGRFTKGLTFANVGARVFTFSLRGLAIAARGLRAALLGPLNIIMMIVSFAPYILKKLGIMDDTGAKKAAKQKQKLAEAGILHSQKIQEQLKSVEGLNETTVNLDKALEKWGKKAEQKMPMLPAKAFRMVSTRLENMLDTKQFGKNTDLMRSQIEHLRKVFTEPGFRTPKELERAKIEWSMLSSALEGVVGLGPEADVFRKAIKAGRKGLHGFTNESDLLARAMIVYGYQDKERVAAMQKGSEETSKAVALEKAHIAIKEREFTELQAAGKWSPAVAKAWREWKDMGLPKAQAKINELQRKHHEGLTAAAKALEGQKKPIDFYIEGLKKLDKTMAESLPVKFATGDIKLKGEKGEGKRPGIDVAPKLFAPSYKPKTMAGGSAPISPTGPEGGAEMLGVSTVTAREELKSSKQRELYAKQMVENTEKNYKALRKVSDRLGRIAPIWKPEEGSTRPKDYMDYWRRHEREP